MKPAVLHITARQACDFALMRGGISQPFHDPLAAVHAMIAVQAQYSASVPFAIHARCPSAPRTWTDQALARERSLVKTWCLRGTLHALAAEDLALIVGSCGERHHLAIERVMLRMSDMDTATWYHVEQDTLHALAAGPLDRTALHAAVPRLRDVPGAGWGEDVKGLAYQGDLLVVGSKGARPVFARRDIWLPDLRFRPHTRIKSLEELLVRYLRTFAPATLTDFAHWTGLPIARHMAARPALPSAHSHQVPRGAAGPLPANVCPGDPQRLRALDRSAHSNGARDGRPGDQARGAGCRRGPQLAPAGPGR